MQNGSSKTTSEKQQLQNINGKTSMAEVKLQNTICKTQFQNTIAKYNRETTTEKHQVFKCVSQCLQHFAEHPPSGMQRNK
jgi:hypothetical protein